MDTKKKKKSLIDELPVEIAEGARQYFRDHKNKIPSTEWTRHCVNQYELHRLNTSPGQREALNARSLRRYYANKEEARA